MLSLIFIISITLLSQYYFLFYIYYDIYNHQNYDKTVSYSIFLVSFLALFFTWLLNILQLPTLSRNYRYDKNLINLKKKHPEKYQEILESTSEIKIKREKIFYRFLCLFFINIAAFFSKDLFIRLEDSSSLTFTFYFTTHTVLMIITCDYLKEISILNYLKLYSRKYNTDEEKGKEELLIKYIRFKKSINVAIPFVISVGYYLMLTFR